MSENSSPAVRYYYINLERATDRRASAERQAKQFGITLERIEAIQGSDLDMSRLEGFSPKLRKREFASDLTPNEHACIQSHLKALRTFVESGADYGVILEDDFLLQEDFNEGIAWLTQETSGWESLKLFTEDNSKLYPLIEHPQGCRRQLIFPKKLPWVAVGNIYTRKGAQEVLKGFEKYWMGYDVQLGWIWLMRCIPVCGVTPSLVLTSDPNNENSTIDADAPRMDEFARERKERSWGIILRHRLNVWRMSWGKKRMMRLMKKRLSVHSSAQ